MNAVSSRFAIVNPCQNTWADLHGDGRTRYCNTCRTSVHAIEEYSGDEWAKIWGDAGGRVCGFRCDESPPEPRSRRVVLVGALLTAISPLMAQSGRVRIMVTDTTGAVIPRAEASLLGPDNKPMRTEHANERGEILFGDLPLGNSRFAVFTLGFATQQLTTTIRNADEVRLETALKLGIMGEVVTVEQMPLGSTQSQIFPAPMPLGSTLSQPSPTPMRLDSPPPPPTPTSKPKRRWWQIFH